MHLKRETPDNTFKDLGNNVFYIGQNYVIVPKKQLMASSVFTNKKDEYQ